MGKEPKELWTEVDHFFEGLLLVPDPVMDAVSRSAVEAGLPPIAVSPAQGKLLHLLARIAGAKKILELGTLAGYSTIWMARAVVPGGRVVTLEADPKHAEVSRKNFAAAGLAEVIELRLGKAIESLPRLAAEGAGPFDLIFIDADKANIPEYYNWAKKLSHPGTVIVIDNVVREGAVTDPSNKDPDVQGVRRLHEMLAEESRAPRPGVAATTIQTVGVKGYDGFTIARIAES